MYSNPTVIFIPGSKTLSYKSNWLQKIIDKLFNILFDFKPNQGGKPALGRFFKTTNSQSGRTGLVANTPDISH